MALNPSIILAGRNPDFTDTMGRAVQTAGNMNALRQSQQLQDIYRQHGAGIMEGNPEAMNALAQVNAPLAFDMSSQRQQLDMQGQRLEISREQLDMERENARLRAAELATQMDQQTRAQALSELQGALSEIMAVKENPALLRDALRRNAEAVEQMGFNPGQVMQNPQLLDAIAARVVGSAEGIQSALEMGQGGQEPASIQALRIRAQEAGLAPGTEAYQEFMRRGGTIPQGMVLETTPDGGMRFAQGEGVGGEGGVDFTEAQSKDNVYAVRARGALEALMPVFDTLASRQDRAFGWAPLGLGRGLQDPDFQVAEQAGTEFLQAILRKDTGAAITQDETESYGRVYLPYPGDSPAVLEAKRQAVVRAINAIESGMEPAQMLARDRALVASARESAEGRQDAAEGSDQPPEQPPENLSAEDRELWQYMTPQERRAIMQAYEAGQ